MKKIYTLADLRTEIAMLEIKQSIERRELRTQLKMTYENLRPSNLIKHTLKELTSAPDLKGDLINSAIGIAAGYVSKRVMFGSTHSPVKQIFGTLLQVGVTSMVSKNADGIKSSAAKFISMFFGKKEAKLQHVVDDDSNPKEESLI